MHINICKGFGDPNEPNNPSVPNNPEILPPSQPEVLPPSEPGVLPQEIPEIKPDRQEFGDTPSPEYTPPEQPNRPINLNNSFVCSTNKRREKKLEQLNHSSPRRIEMVPGQSNHQESSEEPAESFAKEYKNLKKQIQIQKEEVIETLSTLKNTINTSGYHLIGQLSKLGCFYVKNLSPYLKTPIISTIDKIQKLEKEVISKLNEPEVQKKKQKKQDKADINRFDNEGGHVPEIKP